MFQMKRRGWQKTLHSLKSTLQDGRQSDLTRVETAIRQIDAALGLSRKQSTQQSPLVSPGSTVRRRSARAQFKAAAAGMISIGPEGGEVSIPMSVHSLVLDSVRHGKVIAAIKLVREHAQPECGLKEAKDAVEKDQYLTALRERGGPVREKSSSRRKTQRV